VTCIARFDSDGQLGTDDIWSVLRVIWYQEEFAFLIDDRPCGSSPRSTGRRTRQAGSPNRSSVTLVAERRR